jgi:hypothetical protein
MADKYFIQMKLNARYISFLKQLKKIVKKKKLRKKIKSLVLDSFMDSVFIDTTKHDAHGRVKLDDET